MPDKLKCPRCGNREYVRRCQECYASLKVVADLIEFVDSRIDQLNDSGNLTDDRKTRIDELKAVRAKLTGENRGD